MPGWGSIPDWIKATVVLLTAILGGVNRIVAWHNKSLDNLRGEREKIRLGITEELNRTAAAIRNEFQDTKETCTRHDEAVANMTGRLYVVEADIKGLRESYGQISDQLEQIERRLEERRRDQEKDAKELANMLGKLQANVENLMNKKGNGG